MTRPLSLLANYAVGVYGLVVVYLGLSGRGRLAKEAIVVALLTWVVGTFIKDFFYFPRPFVSLDRDFLGYLPDGSFPSVHTAVSLAVAAVVYRKLPWLGVILVLLSLIIGWSRVWGGLHRLGDVVGGAILGVLVAHLLVRWIDNYHSKW